MKRVKRIIGRESQQRGQGSARALAVLAAGGLVAGVGYAHAAARDGSPEGSPAETAPDQIVEHDTTPRFAPILRDLPLILGDDHHGAQIEQFKATLQPAAGGQGAGDGLILPGVDEELLQARQKQEQGAFGVYKRNLESGYFRELREELDSGRITKQEVSERIEEALRRERFVARWFSIDLMYQDLADLGEVSFEDANKLLMEARKLNGYFDSPYGSKDTMEVVEPALVIEIMYDPNAPEGDEPYCWEGEVIFERGAGPDAPEEEPIQVEPQVEPIGTQGRLTPMDDAYWRHSGIRALSEYAETPDDC